MPWIALFVFLPLISCASAFAQDADYQAYHIETDSSSITLPFKIRDVENMQARYSHAVKAISHCQEYQGGWRHLPANLDVSVSVFPRKGACRIQIVMEDIREYTCLLTPSQYEQLGSAMAVYSEGKTLPNLYAPDIQKQLYHRSCESHRLN